MSLGEEWWGLPVEMLSKHGGDARVQVDGRRMRHRQESTSLFTQGVLFCGLPNL
jgi:hypothetical protein